MVTNDFNYNLFSTDVVGTAAPVFNYHLFHHKKVKDKKKSQ